jgi:hypothetical protein
MALTYDLQDITLVSPSVVEEATFTPQFANTEAGYDLAVVYLTSVEVTCEGSYSLNGSDILLKANDIFSANTR